MSEIHKTLTTPEYVSPLSPTPGQPTWSQFYGVPATLTTVTSSVINNPDGQNGTSTVTEPLTYQGVNFVINNPLPFWNPDPTHMTEGSFKATPFTGSIPIGN